MHVVVRSGFKELLLADQLKREKDKIKESLLQVKILEPKVQLNNVIVISPGCGIAVGKALFQGSKVRVIPQSMQSEVKQVSYERRFPLEKKERLACNQSK